jgi:hypothetical protein
MGKVKRLAPNREAIRHLFAHSGNVCAFPGCHHPLIDSRGNFVAEVCHIEAAEPSGARFNSNLTNEQRRHRDNLLLMCHRHHVTTDTDASWSVKKMRELKAAHERLFEESVQRIARSRVVDLTKDIPLKLPKNLERWGKVLGPLIGWLTEDELLTQLRELLVPFLRKFGRLAPDTRAVLLIVVDRGTRREGSHSDDLGLPLRELTQVTSISAVSLHGHIDTLTRYGFAHREREDRHYLVTSTIDGWRFWSELKQFCLAGGDDLAVFLNDLRFDLLD